MSHVPRALNDDLQRLQNEGFEVAIRNGQVVLTSIPYVTANREVKLGTLMTSLNESAGVIGVPQTHQAWFQGEVPCDSTGKRIEQIYHSTERRDIGGGLVSDHGFSAKGPEGMPQSYYRLFQIYLDHICPHAAVLKPGISPATFRPIESGPEEDVFCYRDTNSERGRFVGASHRFHGLKVAVIGCGGTGSYLVDFISKTPVAEIHLFDRDVHLQHNAFRAPGATPLSVFADQPKKVEYLKKIYSAMHRGIHVHPEHMDVELLSKLDDMSFVFIAIDKPELKGVIAEYLEAKGIAFIDVGMGVQAAESSLYGQVRTTLSTPADRSTFKRHVALRSDDGGVYDSNIQIAELNAMNAALAVVRWKKYIGFYHDQRQELHSIYSLSDQLLVKEPVDV